MKSIIKINRKLISILLFLILVSFSSVYAYSWYEDFDDYNINPNYYAGSPSSYIIEDSYIKSKWAVASVENNVNCPYFDGNFDVEFKIYVAKISGTVPILEQRIEKYGTPLHSVKLDGNSFLLTNYVDGTQGSSSAISSGKAYHLEAVYDGSTLTLYVDGTKEITLPTSASYSSTDYVAFPVWNTSTVTWLDLIDIHLPGKKMVVSIQSDKDNYLLGDEAGITVTVQDQTTGEYLLGCIINETVTYPDGTQSNTLEWTDNNDGTYTSSLELPQSGEYMVGVIVSKQGYKDGEASTEFEVLDAQEIADAYKPYMYFFDYPIDKFDEKFRPTIVEDMLKLSGFWKCYVPMFPEIEPERTKLEDPPLSEEDICEFQNADYEYYYLDLLDDGSGDLKSDMIGKESAKNTVYAHVTPDEYEGKKYLVVQYWFHYLYNYLRADNHEGEWEMIEVLIDYDEFEQEDIGTTPIWAIYARHIGPVRELWNEITKCDDNGNINENGNHPVVYVARGSHAAYFEPGKYVLYGVSWIIRAFDYANGVGDPIESNVKIIENQLWLEFGGNWGYVRPSEWQDGPTGPKYKGDAWYEPADWGLNPFAINPSIRIGGPHIILPSGCPADMFAMNSQGQITGTKDGEFIQEIPDSYVNSIGEEEIYLVPANDVYTIEIHGTGDGEFNFIPEFSSWNESRVFGYTDIPVTSNTIAYSEIDPNMIKYKLEIDYDGDTIIDETITPNIGLSLSSPNAIQPMKLNTTLNYEIDVTNEGDQENTFSLEYKVPKGWTGTLSEDIITLGSKETKTITFSVNVPDTEIKDYEMRVTASSNDGLNTFLNLIASAKPELTVSNLSMAYNENEVILSCDASNLGLLDANNILIRFYNEKPENNNIIGEKIIDLASEETKNVSVSWTTEDGIYNIYAVIDPDNAIEETSEYNNTIFRQFTIDRTPPEANIKFNTETHDIEVIGVDNIDEDVEVSYEEYTEKFTKKDGLSKNMETEFKKRGFRTYRIYTLEDDSGNTLKMKMLYLKLRKVIYTKIVELSYNGELKTPQRNAFSIVPHYWRGKLKNLVQHLRIDREFVNVVYNARRDESIITTKEGVEKRDGLVLAIMKTENGDLSYVLE